MPEGGLGRANLYGARALGAGLDFERDTLAADKAIEVERGYEAAAVEEVFLTVLGCNEAETAVANDLLDCTGGHK
jgi:hypothetical protein